MPLPRAGYALLGLIALVYAAVTALALSIPYYYSGILGIIVRLAALYGFLMVATAVMMTPFLIPIARIFGRPFLRVHHAFAVGGVLLLTVHPISFAVLVMTPAVFIPNFQSWIDFWANAGRPAFILLYIAILGGLLRTRLKQWRYFHSLMYVMLLFAIVHGNLIGTDFTNPGIRIVYNGAFAGVVIAFLLNIRKKLHRMKRTRSPVTKRPESENS
jgi:hypothetical protein